MAKLKLKKYHQDPLSDSITMATNIIHFSMRDLFQKAVLDKKPLSSEEILQLHGHLKTLTACQQAVEEAFAKEHEDLTDDLTEEELLAQILERAKKK